MFKTLIEASELSKHLEDPSWLIIDCRFSLQDENAGMENYQKAHIPGAIYANLNTDLSDPHVPGVTGRHPLPGIDRLKDVFSRMGIETGIQVIAYDAAGGASAAARLWWLCRWLGHQSVAVLDGGWQRWLAEIGSTRSGWETRPRKNFQVKVNPNMYMTVKDVDAIRLDPAFRLIDVRTKERYMGLHEPIDPVAGHIPGAINLPYSENLTENGCFRSREELRQKYQSVLDQVPPDHAVFYCGSGVTAAHSILAMEYVGFEGAKLYAGSWSEWITDPHRPVA